MIRNFTFFLGLLFFPFFVFSQGTLCQNADPFCTGTTATFPAGVNSGTAQPGANYGCLYTQPNPAWYFMQVANPGDIQLTITTAPIHDIDFACWGPFNSPTSPCVAQLTAGSLTPTDPYPGPSPYYPSGNMIDCSYSIYGTEYCYIPNAQTGQYYLLLITNYSNQTCDISFSQTGGTGTTSCTILPYLQGDTVCIGQTIHLQVTIPTPGATYAWTGPNSFVSNLQNPTIPNATPANAGTYTMVMTVGGVPQPAVTCDVFVGQWPTISITPTSPTACVGTPFVLTGHSTEPNTTYHWSNGNNNNPTTVSPIAPQWYYVTGTTQWGCPGVDSVYVNTLPTPTVTLSGTPIPVCGGSTVTLNAGGAVSYQWSNSLNGNPVFAIPVGSTTYSVTGTALNGCTASASLFVQTVGPPVNITASPDSICDGGTAVLTASFGLTYLWSNSLGTNPTVNVSPVTTTTYTVTATDFSGCTASTFRTIEVNPTVPVTVTITSTPPIGPLDTICGSPPTYNTNAQVVIFHVVVVNGGPNPSFQWKKNGANWGAVLYLPNTNKTAPPGTIANGDVITCVVSSTAPCAQPIPATSNSIIVHTAAVLHASVSVTLSPTGTICAGTNVTFTAHPVSGGVPAYQWNLNGSPIGGATNSTYSSTTLANGNIITCVMTSSLSCALNNPATSPPITMSVVPVPNPTINPAGPFCLSEPPVNLTSVSPGGTWSGPGITDSILGTFNPGGVSFGMQTITYILSNGICEDTGYANIDVQNIANASIVPAGPFCVSNPPLTLISVSAGGTWSGPGIISGMFGIFDPSAAGVGSHVIAYMINDVCSDTGYTTIIVTNTANANINPAGPFCTNGAPYTLTAGTVGGTWGGPGITNDSLGTFDPSVAGAGTHQISYMISAGLCADTGYINLIVNAAPNATINPAGPFCTTDLPVNLTAVNTGGTWSGTGITNASLGTFSPSVAGAGPHVISYLLTSGLCSSTGQITINVQNPPDATITAAGPYCSDHAPVNLTAATSGGTWSGTGITNASLGTFNPAVAGIGPHTITYTVTVGNCSDVDNISITVNAAVNATINSAGPFCITDGPYTMTAASPGGLWSGAGITSATLGTFNPGTAGAGTHLIIYTINGSCSDTGYANVVVTNTPNAHITSTGPVCSGVGSFNLASVQVGGVWSGAGITNSAMGTFNPVLAGAGNHVISYTITIGGCSDTDTLNLFVIISPNATINSAGPFCLNQPATNLSAVNPGGTWSGVGITSTSLGTFDPAVAGFGIHLISYVLTNGICSDTGTLNVTVNNNANATINPAGPFCTSDTATYLTAVNPGGTWGGTGITNTFTGKFDPAAAGPGTHTISYTLLGPCPDTGHIDIIVNQAASAAIDPAGPYCSGGSPVTLTAAGAGGVWSGIGITDSTAGTFDPAIAGTGVHTITYMISGNCADTGTIAITVNDQADATISSAGPYCYNQPAMNLSAADPGGTWSGNGITNTTDGTFDPALAGAGSHTIIYTIAGTCGDSDTVQVIVYPDLTVTAAVLSESCNGKNDGSIDLTVTGGTSPFTYQWTSLGSTSDFVENLAPGAYIVTVEDSNHCSKSPSYEILASDILCFEPVIYLPNIFSPNGDGQNDVFKVRGRGIDKVELTIYDRYGEVLYLLSLQPYDEKAVDGWDGKFKGQPMQNGVYIYTLHYTMVGISEEQTMKGSVTLSR